MPSFGIEAAIHSGLTKNLLERAKIISEKLSKHQIINKIHNINEKLTQEKYFQIIEMFLSLNFINNLETKGINILK
jgi:DNA mismatch repair ATPase MutS